MRSALALVTLFAALLVASGPPAVAAATASGGLDDRGCRPSERHPSPVVLLHGLGGNGPGNLGPLGRRLAGEGYCAYQLTYGQPVPGVPVGGLNRIEESAREIGEFIERVRADTGASKVDIVGHSEGGFLSLYVPKKLGIARKVDTVVALAPPTHGTTFGGLVSVADTAQQRELVDRVLRQSGCQACPQLLPGGSAVRELDDGPIAQDGIAYTVIATRADALVTPHESELLGTEETAFIRERGVHNLYVQDEVPVDAVGHIGLAYDEAVHRMVLNALDPDRAEPLPPVSAGVPL
ncbi:alpha/beta hydrolase [Pseudonocardia eucalypti]|uniref:Alpha/beta hydrolase n=1 Tax=Pseudonocardia eucalypti TaxID=648755 RepID=A0ABP9QW60_9PSEU|nr:triacylglycerol esterase/lipase EstA (alpha/beta hydrolase family) [Pseudonocardia eucalypti]